MLKKVLYVIVSLVALIFIAAAFLPSTYYVERSVEVNKPTAEVFEYVRVLRNQQEFAVWQAMDPDAIKEYTGEDGQIGSTYSWDSQMDEVGAGEQELIKVEAPNRLEWELRFIRPFESTDVAFMTTTATENGGTKVTWGFDGSMDYPSNLMLLFMDFDAMLGPQLKEGLDNLKEQLEK